MPSATKCPIAQLVQYLHEHGVTFKVDDDFLNDMKGEGAIRSGSRSDPAGSSITRRRAAAIPPIRKPRHKPAEIPTKRSPRPMSFPKVFTVRR